MQHLQLQEQQGAKRSKKKAEGSNISHVAQCKAVLKDEAAIEAAAKRLGGQFLRGEKVVRFYEAGFMDDSSTWKDFFSKEEAARIAKLPSHERREIINNLFKSATHVIRFAGTQYDLGIYRQPDGTFRLRWDTWSNGGGLHKFIGSDGGLFAQAAAVEAAKRAALRKGYKVNEKRNADGSIALEMLVR